MKVPDKKELRDKYNIHNDDFEVREEMPSDSEIKARGWLELVSPIGKTIAYIWKASHTAVIAVIILTMGSHTFLHDTYPDKVMTKTEFQTQHEYRTDHPFLPGVGFVAVVPDDHVPERDAETRLPLSSYSATGTAIYSGASLFPIANSGTSGVLPN